MKESTEIVRSNLECGFTVDLTDYIADSGIDLWVYGHSHRSIETVIGRTRMASNQVGYVVYGEYAKSFSGDKVVDLDFPTDNILLRWILRVVLILWQEAFSQGTE